MQGTGSSFLPPIPSFAPAIAFLRAAVHPASHPQPPPISSAAFAPTPIPSVARHAKNAALHRRRRGREGGEVDAPIWTWERAELVGGGEDGQMEVNLGGTTDELLVGGMGRGLAELNEWNGKIMEWTRPNHTLEGGRGHGIGRITIWHWMDIIFGGNGTK
jgi:hypothetical protein